MIVKYYQGSVPRKSNKNDSQSLGTESWMSRGSKPQKLKSNFTGITQIVKSGTKIYFSCIKDTEASIFKYACKYSGISIRQTPLIQKMCLLYRDVHFTGYFSKIVWPQSKAIRSSSNYPFYRDAHFIVCLLYRDSTVLLLCDLCVLFYRWIKVMHFF